MDDYPPNKSNIQNNRNLELDNAIPKPNLSIIESKDPSISEGFKIIYNKEVPMDLKLDTSEGIKDIALFQLIRFKILSNAASKEEVPTEIKIELSWEKDLLFHYTNSVGENEFSEIKKNQNFHINFSQYCDIICKICDDCINSPDTFMSIFTIQKEGISKLQFIKNSDFKFLDLLLIRFYNSPDEIIRKHILYRFGYVKSKLEYDKKIIKIAGDVILECNPDVMQPILDDNSKFKLDINKYFDNKFEEK